MAYDKVFVEYRPIVEVDFAANVNTDLAVLRLNGEIVIYGSGAPEISVPFSPAIRKGVHMGFFIVYELNFAVRERAITDLLMLLEGII